MFKTSFLLLSSLLIIITSQPAAAQTDLKVGGYFQTWYVADQKMVVETDEASRTSGFRLNRARLTASGDISKNFSATTWFDFSSGSNNLLDFYADLRLTSEINFRIGQFIMPGQSYDTGKLVSSKLLFWNRPNVTTALSRGMGYGAFRDIGLMAYGQHKNMSYAVHAGNGFGRFTQTGSHITEREFGSGLYGIRLDYQLTKSLILGGHFSTNQQKDVVLESGEPFDIERSSYSFRIAARDLLIKKLYAQIEWMSLHAGDESRGIILNDNEQYNLEGFYIDAGYKLNRNWHLTSRFDRIIEKPRQNSNNDTLQRFKKDGYTFGISHYRFQDDREFARFHLNYSFEDSGPFSSEQSILVLVAQFRFIPI